jgi:hypothetical protein
MVFTTVGIQVSLFQLTAQIARDPSGILSPLGFAHDIGRVSLARAEPRDFDAINASCPFRGHRHGIGYLLTLHLQLEGISPCVGIEY